MSVTLAEASTSVRRPVRTTDGSSANASPPSYTPVMEKFPMVIAWPSPNTTTP